MKSLPLPAGAWQGRWDGPVHCGTGRAVGQCSLMMMGDKELEGVKEDGGSSLWCAQPRTHPNSATDDRQSGFLASAKW